MNSLTVELGDRSYPIVLGNTAEWIELLLKKLANRTALIVTDENVDAAGHLEKLEALLSQHNYTDFQSLILPAGEEHKSLATVELIAKAAVAAGLDRKSCMIALSGGVVGDLTGFTAAIYMRGIEFIQLPTTLLAAVDSSVGGKTGADLAEGKNLVGAFHQPQMVALDMQTLTTLPETEYRNGLAEVVKYGVIMNKNFFDLLAANTEKINSFDPDFYAGIIIRSCECKAQVVAGDEREQGRRAILNYGHTVGHAIEKLSNFTLPHGRAVAIGMAAAAKLAVMMNLCSKEVETIQNQLLEKLHLPTRLPEKCDVSAVIQAMKSDKKNSNNRITMVLPTEIGNVKILPLENEKTLQQALESML